MLAGISLYLLSVVGAVFWVISTEGLAITYGTQGWNPLLVALLCAGGQNSCYVLVYFGGRELIDSWQRLADAVEKVHDKYGAKLDTGFAWLTAAGSMFGIPPAVGMVALAPGFGLRLPQLLAITFPLRFIRFTILAWAGDSIFG